MRGFLFLAVVIPTLFGWTAYQNNPEGMLSNPAYLGWINESEMHVWGLNGDRTDFEHNHGISMNFEGIGFSYRRAEDLYDYDLGLGINDPRGILHVGYLYNWQKYQGHIDRSWSLGALVQPTEWTSFGWTYHKWGNERRNTHSFGIAVRPLSEKITLFADGLLEEKGEVKDIIYSAGAELHLINGIRIYGDYDIENETIGFGLRLDMPNAGWGAESRMIDDEMDDIKYFVHMSTHRFSSIFPGGPKKKLQMNLEGDIAEQEKFAFFSFDRNTPLIELLEEIEYVKDNKELIGFQIYWKNPSLSFAQAYELRKALVETDKEIIIYAKNLGNLDYYVCSSADWLGMTHGGYLSLVGLGADVKYFKETLDKIGARMEVISAGKYKDIGIFTDTLMSDVVREEQEALLTSLNDEFISRIAERNDMGKAKAQGLVDEGPYSSEQALAEGLIDSVLFPDEFGETQNLKLLNRVGLESYKSRDESFGPNRKIAIIYAEGEIVGGEGGRRGLMSKTTIGPRDIERAVKEILDDGSVKGVVLRVSSPGGSAQASEEMWHHLMKLKEKDIPLIVSMGSVAASGGYYLSAAGDKIYADPNTITGSIGVIAMKPSIGGLLDKIGVNSSQIKKGENSLMYSLSDTFTTAQKEKLTESLKETYILFKERVSEGRNMSMEEVEEVAQGRVWTGTDAKEQGLVDEIGDLMDAIAHAANEAGIEDYTIKTYGAGGFPGELFKGIAPTEPEVALENGLEKLLGERVHIPSYPFNPAEPLMLSPSLIEIK